MRAFAILFAFIFLSLTPFDGHAKMPGGSFILTDHHGKVVTNVDFMGRYQIYYFGYTFCPDICPTGLQTISDTLDLLGDDAQDIVPLFVTVDPARDTVPVMADYVANFHPSLIGLVGTPAMVEGVAKKYKIRYEKVVEPDMDEDQYIMDHTASMLFMGPDGKFLAKFAHGIAPEAMAKRIREIKASKRP